MTDKRNGVPTLRAAVSDWLGKFAAYRLDCLSKGIWRESDEFIWDSTAPIVDALAATLAPTPPDAPDARGECHKGCDLCRTLNEMDVDDAVPTPPDALTIDQKVEELERIIHPEGRCWCGAGKPYWKHIDPSADGYHPFVPTPPDALDVARIRSIIMDTTDQLLTELDELHFSQKGIIQTRNRILRRLAEELGG